MSSYSPRSLRFRLQPLEAAVLSCSVAGHALCVWGAYRSYDPAFHPFFLELVSCIVFSAIGSVISTVSTYRERFRFVHALKFIAVAMAAKLNGDSAPFIDLVPMASLLAELALYEDQRWAVLAAAGETAAALGFAFDGRSASIRVFYGCFMCGAFASFSLITRYREKLVEAELALENYSNAFKKLAESDMGLRSFAASSGRESAEQERKRISGALHDSIGYALTNIVAASSAIGLLVEADPAQTRALARETCELSTNCLREVRQTLHVLRSIKEETPPLVKAIERAATVFRTTTGVEVEFNHGNLPWEFENRALNQSLYRFVQEGMTNAFRHGQADFVRISMWMTENRINARIWDNGRGCETIEEGMGITDLRERIEDLGGSIRIEPQRSGFGLLVTVPYGASA